MSISISTERLKELLELIMTTPAPFTQDDMQKGLGLASKTGVVSAMCPELVRQGFLRRLYGRPFRYEPIGNLLERFEKGELQIGKQKEHSLVPDAEPTPQDEEIEVDPVEVLLGMPREERSRIVVELLETQEGEVVELREKSEKLVSEVRYLQGKLVDDRRALDAELNGVRQELAATREANIEAQNEISRLKGLLAGPSQKTRTVLIERKQPANNHSEGGSQKRYSGVKMHSRPVPISSVPGAVMRRVLRRTK